MKCAPLSELSLKSTPLLARIATCSPQAREAADERGAVGGLILVEAAAVDEAGDDLAHVELNLHVPRNDPVELLRIVARLLRLFAVERMDSFSVASLRFARIFCEVKAASA
jgi:hypothetical protein